MRARQGPAQLKFHQALRVCSLEPRAFVPFNQYVIKLKSQLKNSSGAKTRLSEGPAEPRRLDPLAVSPSPSWFTLSCWPSRSPSSEGQAGGRLQM